MSKKKKKIAEVMEGGSKELYQLMAARMSSETKEMAGEGSSNSHLLRPRPTICRVPEWLSKLKPTAYTPRVISIGPLHQNDLRLTAIQDHKFKYMHTLFGRTAKSQETCKRDADLTLQECVDAMFEAVSDARTCYGESLTDTDFQLANTLLVDGCFILELLFKFVWPTERINDPLFMNNLALGGIKHDLLLLENQIPFSVLEKLFRLTFPKIKNLSTTLLGLEFTRIHSELSLTQYVVQFFGHMMIFGSEMTERDNGTTEIRYDHILGFLHNYYQPASNGDPGRYPAVKYSATQLHRTGVKFKASKRKDYVRVRFQTSCFMISWFRRCCPCNTRRESTSEGVAQRTNYQVFSQTSSIWFLFSLLQPRKSTDSAQLQSVMVNENGGNDQISTQTSSIWNLLSRLRTLLPKTPPSNWSLFQLCSSPCLELPPLCIYDHTESFLRNLIAYEQCSLTIPHYITSYAFLMDTLIDSKEDVELLENEKVLKNYLGASEDASDLFNNLCKEIFLMEFYFSDQWKQLNDYCNLYWPKHLASLRRTYFSNPWAIISLGGALVLFGFTAVQTYYTIKSYLFSLRPN